MWEVVSLMVVPQYRALSYTTLTGSKFCRTPFSESWVTADWFIASAYDPYNLWSFWQCVLQFSRVGVFDLNVKVVVLWNLLWKSLCDSFFAGFAKLTFLLNYPTYSDSLFADRNFFGCLFHINNIYIYLIFAYINCLLLIPSQTDHFWFTNVWNFARSNSLPVFPTQTDQFLSIDIPKW